MSGEGEAVRDGRRISTHAVCTAIRDDIVSGTFPPGSRLTEELLARRYGVSRVPVREALRTLASEGFVTTRRHAGAAVAEPTEQEAADLLEVRALLEPLGAARAAQRRTEAHLKVLRGLVRLGQERARGGRAGELRPLGDWFDETLAQASGSPSLAALLTQLRLKIAWVYVPEPPARPVEIWETCAALVDAVARGDAERARALAAARADRAPGEYRLRSRAAAAPAPPARRAQPKAAGDALIAGS
ncbi:GntR family transcriptional regulator [Streptomyces gamaensis]|uniref:GntR family transcriptional regulator n=1 Tax=Streptomyces gamaensis TaxID=1763542 RepID=A0ABW0Z9D1_9ACTN